MTVIGKGPKTLTDESFLQRWPNQTHKVEMLTIRCDEEMLSGMGLEVKEFAIPAGKMQWFSYPY